MKILVLTALYLTLAWAVPVEVPSDENCSVQWVTVYQDPPSSTSLSPSSSSTVLPLDGNNKVIVTHPAESQKVDASPVSANGTSTGTADHVSSTLQTSSSGSSGLRTTNHAGEPGFSVDGEHLSAPEASDAIPAEAMLYTPASQKFSGKDFSDWWAQQETHNPSTKFVKIKPGVYDLSVADGIAIGFRPGGWTLDLRGVTFLVAPDIPDPTSGQAIYINQSEDMLILGGTVWFDQGELWSQARVTSIKAIDDNYSTVTYTVEEGYNVSVWNSAGPRNQGCVDTSDSNHFTRPHCNFWFADNYNFAGLSGDRTFTNRVASQAGIKEGYHITTIAGPNMRTTIASEFNGGLRVNGMTSNGGLAQYGLTGKVTATFENVWNVNPPARPGFAAPVQGPTLSQGHIGLFDFDAEGDAPIVYKNCWWQTTGSRGDLQDMSDQDLH